MKSERKYFGIISSKNLKANEIKNYISKSLNTIELEDKYNFKNDKILKAIIVIGGDGEMLHALHQFYKLSVPFIGINAGSIGFLMNESCGLDLLSNIETKESITLFPLQMTAYKVSGIKKSLLAFNEVSVYRATNQAAKIQVIVNNEIQIKELISDGIIVSTPAGSSAYNFSTGGRIVPLDSKVICITPVCPFRPRRWHGAILPESSKIDFTILEHSKRPVNAVADFNELKDVVKITIEQQNKISVKLVFTSHYAFSERMIKEQFMV